MKFHHIGYFVDDIAAAVCEFEKLGYSRQTNLLRNLIEPAYAIFLKNDESTIELVEANIESSSLYGLRKKYKNSPYHVCYSTKDINMEVSRLCEAGYTLLPPGVRIVPELDGQPRVAFLWNPQIGMVELMEGGI